MSTHAQNGKWPDEVQSVLEVDDLRIDFLARRGRVQAVRGVSFSLSPGETMGLVGESGSGKSVLAQALLGIVDPPGRILSGDIRWNGRSILQGPGARSFAKRIRGREVALISQDPMTALNPLLRIGTQLREVLHHHQRLDRQAGRARALDLLHLVGISSPQRRLRQYPWELSGGMQQRVLIAMALACEPKLLIADEPTTALDVTIQAQILALLSDIQQSLGIAILLITHDLGVVAGFCDKVMVMYAGKILEAGPVEDLYGRPGHPYSAGLLRAIPPLDQPRARLETIEGSPPDVRNPPSGCPFEPRCPKRIDRCRSDMPPLLETIPGRIVACWRAYDIGEDMSDAKTEIAGWHQDG